MTDTEAFTRRKDLKAQAQESARHLMVTVGHMVDSTTPWQRDAFFHEAMKHLSATQGQLLRWHETVCKIQESGQYAPPVFRYNG